MNKKVEYLQKADIPSYIDYIDEVFNYDVDEKSIKDLIKKHKVLVIKEQDKVISSVVIEQRFEYIKNQKYFFISYLGVLKEKRRQGLASLLFEKVEEMAKENDIKYIELTSGNHRRIAHYFYKNKDFKIKDTTVFVKIY